MRGPNNPGGYTREEISALDPWWVQNIILHPRKKDGNLLISHKPRDSECASIEEFVCRKLALLCIPDHVIRKLWRQYARVIPRQVTQDRPLVGIEE